MLHMEKSESTDGVKKGKSEQRIASEITVLRTKAENKIKFEIYSCVVNIINQPLYTLIVL